MDDSFEFRPYIEALIQRWYWLAGGLVVAGLLAFGLSYLLTPTYEASALVLVLDPDQLLQFDPRIETLEETQPRQAYPALAASDAVLEELLAEIAPRVSEPKTIRQLRMDLSVDMQSDPSLLRLTAEHSEPETAAYIANTWADVFVRRTNAVVGDQGGDQVELYLEQAERAQEDLGTAEEAVTAFQAGNRLRIVAAEVLAMENKIAAYLEDQRELEAIVRDAASLRTQLAGQNSEPLPADQMAIELLYIRAFGRTSGEEATLPVQLQLNTGETADRDALLASLDALQSAAQANLEDIDDRTTQLEPELLALQQERQRLANEETRLTREVELATEAYTTLARQLSGEELLAQDTSRGLRLASPAISPERPVAPLKLANAVLAAVVSFVLIAAMIIYQQWRRA